MSFLKKIFGEKPIKETEHKTHQVQPKKDGVWVVEWFSRFGDYSNDTKLQYKTFLNGTEAELFKEQLEIAHKMLRNTNDICIKIKTP